MNTRRRTWLRGVFGLALCLAMIEPAAAQSRGSTITEQLIWGLNNQLLYAAVPITVLVEGILLYTVWKYSKSDEAKPTKENRRLEITWTIATAIILLFVGVASFQVLASPYVSGGAQEAVQEPETIEEIGVIGQTYIWNFEYEVDAEGVQGSGLTLENVTVENATVTNRSAGAITVENARLSGGEIQDARLVNGTVTSGSANGSFADVTVESATIANATIRDGAVSTSNEMVMPAGQDVRLNITSTDWLHAFHVPAMGLKQDAFPGEYNTILTRATEPGEYQLYCAEYCGAGHSQMLGQVTVVSDQAYQQWLVDSWLDEQR